MKAIRVKLDAYSIERLVDDIDAALAERRDEEKYIVDFLDDDDGLLQSSMESYLEKLEHFESYLFDDASTSSAIEQLIAAYNQVFWEFFPRKKALGVKLLINFMRKPLEQILRFLQPYAWEDRRLKRLTDDSLYLNYDAELELLKICLKGYEEAEARGNDDTNWLGVVAAFAVGYWIGS